MVGWGGGGGPTSATLVLLVAVAVAVDRVRFREAEVGEAGPSCRGVNVGVVVVEDVATFSTAATNTKDSGRIHEMLRGCEWEVRR